MTRKSSKLVPALRFRCLTVLYDPLMKWAQEETFKNRFIAQAELLPDQRVLDVGCGTGTLALMLKDTQSRATVMGLDADPEVLKLAQKKAQKSNVDISFHQGLSSHLPFDAAVFNHVFSSLLFHHLTLEMKHKTLQEAFRVLAPGGSLHILDFDKPQNFWMRLAFYPVQVLDGFETTRDHVTGIFLEALREEGFEGIRETNQFNTIVGTLHLYSAKKPY